MTHRDEDEEIIDSALDTLAWQRREIDRLKGDVERLREALREYVYETTHLSPQEEDGSHWCKISANCLNNARAALGEKP